MRKALVRTMIGAVAVLVVIAVTEGQVLSLAAAGVRSLTAPEKSSLFDHNRVHTLNVVEDFTVLAAGDIANCEVDGGLDRTNRNLRYSIGLDRPEVLPNDGMLETTRLIEGYSEAWLLALGDLVYKRGEPVGFEDCYDPYWGAAKERTWPAPGNHEYQTPFAYGYFDYWQDRAGPDREGYYALRAGNWLLLSLNSEIDASPDSPQADWIESVLNAHLEICTAAFYHKPAYSTAERDNSGNAKDLFRLLANSGVSFVMNGHNHFYERTQPLDAAGRPAESSTVTFVAGAGGKTTSREIEPAAFSERLITGTAGVLKLDFSDDAVAWTYLTGNGSDETDSGTLPCRR